ncbi:NAD(P)-binding protein [Pseudovirgaria hyperparasitica]|uniref:NAD(P)-binding protein n=1 Tax=Pseudovirgaria hyperparasitica TaxID=470096 RepID=A0A6A6WEJ9_9PEZI|nr:NAD(P)-binding protein [Pseudovirgaria hyperparasitica]KAF2761143.1 NAD(P)-binding protein [Pseudovirgaria hyperparasitica]
MASLKAQTLFEVTSIVAVITGGGTGIGAHMARALASNGAHKVYITGRRLEVLEETAAPFEDIIIPLQGDVSNKDSLKQMAEQVRSEVGYINLLVANAGMLGPCPRVDTSTVSIAEYAKVQLDIPMEVFTDVLHVNTTGSYYTALAFLELLDAGNKKGNMGYQCPSQIVLTASIFSFMRAGAMALVKSMSTQYIPYDIRVNALAPGFFESAMTENRLQTVRIPQASTGREYKKSFIPQQRTGTEEDIAGAILYLASRAGGYVSGSVMMLDGGCISTTPASY